MPGLGAQPRAHALPIRDRRKHPTHRRQLGRFREGVPQTGPSSHYRTTKLYNSPPYTGYDPAVTVSTRNYTILARLIAASLLHGLEFFQARDRAAG